MMVAANTAMAVVNSPPILPPPVGLIATLTGTPYLVDAETETVDTPGDAPDQRWEGGFQYLPEQFCVSAGMEDPCAPVTMTIPTTPNTVVGIPGLIWAGDHCSTFGFQAHDYQGRATRALLATESKQIAHELWTGRQANVSGWPNNYLAGPNCQILDTGGTGVSAAAGLALLEQGIAETSNGQQGMIHCTRQVGAALSELGNTFRALDGTIVTYMGNLIVADVGYPGTGPGGTLMTDLSTWAYATLMVTVRRSAVDVIPATFAEAMDRSHNFIEFRAERLAVATFPPCTLVGVQIAMGVGHNITGVTVGS